MNFRGYKTHQNSVEAESLDTFSQIITHVRQIGAKKAESGEVEGIWDVNGHAIGQLVSPASRKVSNKDFKSYITQDLRKLGVSRHL